MLARGHVLKPGRTLTVCAGDFVAVADGAEKTVATMLATMIMIQGRPDVSGDRGWAVFYWHASVAPALLCAQGIGRKDFHL
jgi:hypothetical protein